MKDNTGLEASVVNNSQVMENTDKKKEVLDNFNKYLERLNNPYHGEYYK